MKMVTLYVSRHLSCVCRENACGRGYDGDNNVTSVADSVACASGFVTQGGCYECPPDGSKSAFAVQRQPTAYNLARKRGVCYECYESRGPSGKALPRQQAQDSPKTHFPSAVARSNHF